MKQFKILCLILLAPLLIVSCNSSHSNPPPPEDVEKESRKLVAEIKDEYNMSYDETQWLYLERGYEPFTKGMLTGLRSLKKALDNKVISATDYPTYSVAGYSTSEPVQLTDNGTLEISKEAESENLDTHFKYNPKYLQSHMADVEADIETLKKSLQALTLKPVETDYTYTPQVATLWVLKTILSYSESSPARKKIVQKLGSIEITNHSKVYFQYYKTDGISIYEDINELDASILALRVSQDVNSHDVSSQDSRVNSDSAQPSFNQQNFYNYLDTVPSLQKRLLTVVERFKKLQDATKIPQIRYATVLTDIEASEYIASALEAEAHKPENKLNKISSLSIAAGDNLYRDYKGEWNLFLCALNFCKTDTPDHPENEFIKVRGL